MKIVLPETEFVEIPDAPTGVRLIDHPEAFIEAFAFQPIDRAAAFRAGELHIWASGKRSGISRIGDQIGIDPER